MEHKSLEEAGHEVSDMVSSAIQKNDYTRLNESLNAVLASVLDAGNDALKGAVGNALGVRGSGGNNNNRSSQVSDFPTRQKDSILGPLLPNQYFASVNGERIGGYALAAVGSLFSLDAFWRIAWMAFPKAPLLSGGVTGAGIGMVLFFAAAGAFLISKGVKKVKMCTRFASYRRKLGKRSYAAIKELADYIGKPVDFVAEDLGKMIDKGWFREGYLDEDRTTIMVTDEMYEQYQAAYEELSTQKQAQAAREEEERQRREKDGRIPPEAQEVLDKGNACLLEIKACKDAIADKEVSDKISRMEKIIGKLLERVRENPSCADALRKTMRYYLPTTVKLLKAYQELDEQPVQGENIAGARQEISMTLDTLNLAFEKLLDEVFQDTAWDVSSDISVLQTMLAGEGLMESDFSSGQASAGAVMKQ